MAKKAKAAHKYSSQYALKLSVAIFTGILVLLGSAVFFTLRQNTYCANSVTCISDLSGNKQDTNEGVFLGKKVTSPDEPNTPVFALEQMKNVLGASTGDKKHIYVDLSSQRLLAYDGDKLVYNYLISSGKWHATPTGDFRIWVWLRYTRMAGGDPAKGTYYNLPNVPYTMYFYNNNVPKASGFSLHGAYWHSNFGHPMSHGCVNMNPNEAAVIFYWSNPGVKNVAYPTEDTPGTLITIYGTAPAAETAFID